MLNATFLVQIINFWVTYLFLNRLLFRPIVQLLQAKEIAKKHLQRDMKLKEKALYDLQEDRHRQQVAFKMYLQKNYVADVPDGIEDVPEVTYVCDDVERKKLIDESRKILVKKVRHAS